MMNYSFAGVIFVTVSCVFPDDMSILEERLIDVLTDIMMSKCTYEEVEAIIAYLEQNDCEYFN